MLVLTPKEALVWMVSQIGTNIQIMLQPTTEALWMTRVNSEHFVSRRIGRMARELLST
jgi:hypothetical protein